MNVKTLEEAQELITSFCRERDWGQFHTPKDLAIGAVTEAAELVELFRFLSDDETRIKLQNNDFREKVSDELADVFFFLIRFCERNNFSLMECLNKKMVKNAQKYPVDKANGKNLKYTEYE